MRGFRTLAGVAGGYFAPIMTKCIEVGAFVPLTGPCEDYSIPELPGDDVCSQDGYTRSATASMLGCALATA